MSSQLPITAVVPDIRRHLTASNAVILQAPPGAGKSTFLPLQLLDEPWLDGQKILLLEPRRLAARAVAHRLAELYGERVGETIGYRVRFETKVSRRTRLEVVTEGILTRMMQNDNALEGVGLVIFDEFHERSLDADLGLLLCRQIQEVLREEMRILVMSATLNFADLDAVLPDAPTVTSEGRQHPVALIYVPSTPGQRTAAHTASVVRQALREQDGDILVFLPGAGDIRRTAEYLDAADIGAEVHPLFGNLAFRDQDRALRPHPQGLRKVVLATAIAETSLTIEGITTVIDSGLARVPHFDPRSGLTRLETVEVTQDSAAQRAGRAGRLGPGVCYRLWEERRHQYLASNRKPEILTADLAPLVLELAAWGIQEADELPWPSPPPKKTFGMAGDLLESLGALENGKLTRRGKALLKLPTHPRFAHLLLQAEELGLLPLAADVVALLEERDPLCNHSSNDLSLRIDALRAHRRGDRGPGDPRALARVEKVSQVWRKKFKVPPLKNYPEAGQVGHLVALAYPDRVARRVQAGGRYRLANRRRALVPTEDPLSDAEWLAVAHMDAGQEEGRIYLAAPVDPRDFTEEWTEKDTLRWDGKLEKLVAQRETRWRGLLVQSKPVKDIPPAQRVEALCAAVARSPELLPWDRAVSQWQARVMSLRQWRPEEDWPDVTTAKLATTVAEWLAPYLEGVRKKDDFDRLDLKSILNGLLPWPKPQELAQLAPERWQAPSGSQIRVEYFEDGRPPVLAVRLQEMFGCHDTPRVNGGRTTVMVHLLSPARRPVQVTQDLRNFWESTYAEVRKELRGRYSKHYWPEDPFTAEAIQGVRPKGKKK